MTYLYKIIPTKQGELRKKIMEPNSNLSQEEILQKEEIQTYDTPIWEMSRYQLLQRFSAESSGNPVASKIIKNIIWQVFTWIKEQKHPLIRGNLRTFWYMRVKVPLGRVGLLNEPTDHYDTMLCMFVRFTRDYKLFKYKDFGFIDENWENRRIGKTNPHIILFSEKTGFFYYLKELNEKYDITVASLGGQASVLSAEYMVESISQYSDLKRPFYAYSIVDYDPSGWIVERNFIDLLKDQGVEKINLVRLIQPQYYTEEEINLNCYELPTGKSKDTINAHWLEETGGIKGELYGLEAESFPLERLLSLIDEEIEKLRALQILTF